MKHSIGAAVVLLGVLAAGAAASAGHRHERYTRGDRGGDYGYVVAHSQYGNRSVAGPVRPGRFGDEVRLPGGTWVECGRSCAATLRVKTVDFWDHQREENGGLPSPGYFRKEFYID